MPMISALLSPLSSASTCWPAPSEGVLVTAPEKMPRMTASGMSSSRCSRMTMTPPRPTMAMATPFRRRPLWRSEEKKPGPTWMPIV